MRLHPTMTEPEVAEFYADQLWRPQGTENAIAALIALGKPEYMRTLTRLIGDTGFQAERCHDRWVNAANSTSQHPVDIFSADYPCLAEALANEKLGLTPADVSGFFSRRGYEVRPLGDSHNLDDSVYVVPQKIECRPYPKIEMPRHKRRQITNMRFYECADDMPEDIAIERSFPLWRHLSRYLQIPDSTQGITQKQFIQNFTGFYGFSPILLDKVANQYIFKITDFEGLEQNTNMDCLTGKLTICAVSMLQPAIKGNETRIFLTYGISREYEPSSWKAICNMVKDDVEQIVHSQRVLDDTPVQVVPGGLPGSGKE